MDANLLARIQFAVTVGFHFIFPPITIGLSWLIVFMLSRHLMTGSMLYKNMAKFWTKIFGVTFATGVATGLTMEFQFGTNWSNYSRFVGDIFGAPLAAETIFSFFLESSFLGVLLLGWKRLSAKVLWFAALMVAVGAMLSAFWILAANSWQQTPAGYEMVNGKPQLTSIYEAILNPSTIPRFLHTLTAAFITGSFFVISLSAILLRKNIMSAAARQSMRIGIAVAFIFGFLQFPLGHLHAVQVVNTQPAKLAAFEAHFETQKPAYQVLLGIPDEEKMTVHYPIRIPRMLSFLAYGNLTAEVKGLEEYPRDEWPPVALTFLSFRLMVLLGVLFALVPVWGLYLLFRRHLFSSKAFMIVSLLMIPLPTIANQLGWITAEVGRQPWAVWHLLRTAQASSPLVSAGHVLFSLIFICLTYTVIFLVWLFILRELLRKGPEEEQTNGTISAIKTGDPTAI